MQYLQLSSEQILTEFLKKHGLNKLLEDLLNCLMKLEREGFLLEKNNHLNKANGYRLGTAVGLRKKISLSIPRDRLGEFYPVLLTLIREQESELVELAFNLYSKGLTTRDVSDIFTKMYGNNYSKTTISRFNQSFIDEIESWRSRPLEAHYPILIIDAIFSKIRRASKVAVEATYTVMALRDDMTRDIVAIEHVPTESASGWEDLFRSLKERGLQTTKLIVADGLSGLENTIAKVFPEADFQKCVVHLKRNILNKVRHYHKAEVAADLKEIFITDDSAFTQEKAENQFSLFIQKWGKHYRYIKNLENNISHSYYFTYLRYDYRIRSMIYTTNWIENLNKQFRKSLKIRNSMPSEESVLLLLAKVAYDKSEKYLRYPIYNFKFDKKLFPNNMIY